MGPTVYPHHAYVLQTPMSRYLTVHLVSTAAHAMTTALSASVFSFLDVIPHHLDVLNTHRRGLEHGYTGTAVP